MRLELDRLKEQNRHAEEQQRIARERLNLGDRMQVGDSVIEVRKADG